MDPGTITVRQLSAMLFLFLAGGFDAFLPRYVAADAGGATLLSVGLATALALIMVGVILRVALRFSQSDVVQYSVAVWGSPLGQVAGTWYVLLLVFGAAQPLAGVGLIGNVAFGWWAAATPPLIFLLAVACAVLAGQGLRKVARLSEYAAPAALIVGLIVGLAVLGKVNWTNFTMVPPGGWGPVWRGAVHLLGRFSLAYILLLLVPFTKSTRGIVQLTSVTILAAGLMLGIEALPVGLYGAGAAATSFIPSLQLLSDSIFGATPWFFDLAVGLWLLGLLFQVVIAFQLLATLLSQTAGTDPLRFLLPAGAAVAWTGLLLWTNAGGTYTFGEKYFQYLSFPAAIGIPLLLLPGLRMLWAGNRV
ncbi:MAG TPA: GerAB/ArcD/ProY family transporter [Spirochaetia bacterium]|nr:GerAB/ArcD/ProY family transporter [Spirochaetia bacterium]